MKKIATFPLMIFLGGLIADPASAGKIDLCQNSLSPLARSVAIRESGPVNKGEILAKAASLSVPFVQNAGQFAAEVKYAADLFAGRFFLTGNELVYMLSKPGENKDARIDKHGPNLKLEKSTPGKALVFREFFVDQKGSKIGFMPKGEEKAETKVSYFKGNDAGKWHGNIASYQGVTLGEVYPGVQVKLKASGKNVEKVFYVSTNGNVSDIKINIAGVTGLKIDKDGCLMLENGLGELAMRAPVAWQEIDGKRRDVNVGYRLLGKQRYGFKVMGKFNKDFPLIIDPDLDTLMASTFLGGGYFDNAFSIVLDSSGNVYLTGNTASEDFPVTPGAYDRTLNSAYHKYSPFGDVFVSKLDGNLTTLLASTYLGGEYSDYALSLSLDGSGNVYLTGCTDSPDFPVTSQAYDRTYNGGYYLNGAGSGDAFVSKLDGNLTSLLASTFLGGSRSDTGQSLAIDGAGYVCLTGQTYSLDFPTTSNAFDRTYDDDEYLWSAFISKLDSSLTSLLASTFLGNGLEVRQLISLALDSSSNVYLAGFTESTKFPTTPGAYNKSCNGYGDVFISKLNNSLTTLLASTYLGGRFADIGHSLALDSSGNVYLLGSTSSINFPTTPGAFDRSFNGYGDVFISKLNGSLTTLLASTFLGGGSFDRPNSLALDSSCNVYVAGYTSSSDFPTTPGAYDRTYENFRSDAFVSKLNSSLATLLGSSYLGGSDEDVSYSLALDDSGNVYLTGSTISSSFPTTPRAYDRSYCAEIDDEDIFDDIFIAKLDGSLGVVKLDLLAERREVRAFSIVRQYGQIQCTIETFGIPVTEYRLYHRVGSTDFTLVGTITTRELQDDRFQMQDKFLEKDTPYTYLVESYNEAGQLVGRSAEKTI